MSALADLCKRYGVIASTIDSDHIFSSTALGTYTISKLLNFNERQMYLAIETWIRKTIRQNYVDQFEPSSRSPETS